MNLIDTLDAVGLLLPEDRVAVAAIRDGEIRAEVFDDAGKAEAFLKQFDGWNHYLTLNPIKPGVQGRPRATDVARSEWLLVDVDPVPDENAASDVALSIFSWLKERGVGAVLVDSGRGRQVWVNCACDDRKRAVDFFRARFEKPATKIDNTQDAARLCRLPGSVNQKTKRQAKIVALTHCSGALEEKDLPPVSAVASGGKGTWQAENFCLTGVPEGRRDDAVFRYACRLRTRNISKEEALLLVLSASRACTPPFPDHSARDKVERAWKYPSGSEALELALGLAAKCNFDPGAAFEPQALDALRCLKERDPSSWQRVRADLKATRAFRISDLERRLEEGLEPPDPSEIARISVEDGELIGQYFRRVDKWIGCDTGPLRAWLKGHKLDGDEAIRQLMVDSWEVVHRPFEPEEFPETREWNRDAARLAFEPAEGPHPTWDMILENIGKSIDEPARAAGFLSGADYLLSWVAGIVQAPFEPSAFLFFYGPQGGGKSTFHEALRILFTRGCVDAGQALVSKDGFNGEVARAVICYVEEIDLSDARKTAYTRIKRWTTGKTISVHAKHETPHDLRNSTHFIHCANDLGHCAAFPGDSRITVIRVDKALVQVPKEELFKRLEAEAPQFTATLKAKVVPASTGRLKVPVLENAAKKRLMDQSRSALEVWLEENLAWAQAHTDKEVTQKFLEDAGPREALKWDTMRVLRELPEGWRVSGSGTASCSSAPSPAP
jgi:hypothetical protein